MFVVKINDDTFYHEPSFTLAINSAVTFRTNGEVTIVVNGEVVARLYSRRVFPSERS